MYVLLQANIGTNDRDKYDLPEGKAGDVIEVNERQATILIALLKCAMTHEPPPDVEPVSLRSEVLAKEAEAREELPDQPPPKRQPKTKSSPFHKES